jgi:hypothetical protein
MGKADGMFGGEARYTPPCDTKLSSNHLGERTKVKMKLSSDCF